MPNPLTPLKTAKGALVSSLLQAIHAADNAKIKVGKQEKSGKEGQANLDVVVSQEYPDKNLYSGINKWIVRPQSEEAKQDIPYGVEVWTYDDNIDISTALFVEDYALARFQSIYEATKGLLQKDKHDAFVKLLEDKYRALVQETRDKLKANESTDAKERKREFQHRLAIIGEEIKIFYASAIHLIAYADKNAAQTTSSLRELTKADWEKARKKLSEAEQVHIPNYAKRDILVYDKKNKTFEYYQRNYESDQLPEEHTQQFEGIKRVPTIPSHHRVVSGIPNYAMFFYGTYENAQATVEHVGSRHGTLVPYDLYKKRNGKRTSVHEIRWLTFKNMVDVLKQDQQALGQVLDEKKPFTHRYIQLISPAIGGAINSFEAEQFRDMRYGAYALQSSFSFDDRTKTPHAKFSYFCAGIDGFRRFTDESQQTVNNMAILGLYGESFEEGKKIKNDIHQKYIEEVGNLRRKARAYITAISTNNFQDKKLDEAVDKQLKELAKAVDDQEKQVYKASKAYLSELQKEWNAVNWQEKILRASTDEEKAKINCFYLIHQLYSHATSFGNLVLNGAFSNSWASNKAKGLLQALMGLLTELNGDFYSEGCKSGADRASLVAVLLEVLTQIFHDKKMSDANKIDAMLKSIDKYLDRAYVTSGSNILVKFDSRGASPKQKIGTKSAPYLKLAKSAAHIQAKTNINKFMHVHSLFAEAQLREASASDIVQMNVHDAEQMQKIIRVNKRDDKKIPVEAAPVISQKNSAIRSTDSVIRKANSIFQAAEHYLPKDVKNKIYEVLDLYSSNRGMFGTRNMHVDEFRSRTKDLDLFKEEHRHKFLLLLWQHYVLIEDKNSLLKTLYQIALTEFLTRIEGKNIPAGIKDQAFAEIVFSSAIQAKKTDLNPANAREEAVVINSERKSASSDKEEIVSERRPASAEKTRMKITPDMRDKLNKLSVEVYKRIDKIITSTGYWLNQNKSHQDELKAAYNLIDKINNIFVGIENPEKSKQQLPGYLLGKTDWNAYSKELGTIVNNFRSDWEALPETNIHRFQE